MPKQYEVTRKYIVTVPDEGTAAYDNIVDTIAAEEFEPPSSDESIAAYLVYASDGGNWTQYVNATDFDVDEIVPKG